MKATKKVGSVIIIMLILSTTLSVATGTSGVQPSLNLSAPIPTVAILIGSDPEQDSSQQARRLLENKGLVYDVLTESNASILETKEFFLIIVLGSQSQIISSSTAIKNAVEKGGGLIWVGQNLPQNLYDLAGIGQESSTEIEQGTTLVRYGDASTQLYGETIQLVEASNATVKGYFEDSSGYNVGPAELFFKKGSAGTVCYFAYDAFAWWFADEQTPWLRAYRIHLAIEAALSDFPTVRLMPYPRGMRSAFVTRIEDVDPLHTNSEWLNRGEQILSYYSDRNAPLTIALTPTYVDPQLGLNFGIEEPTAHNLKEFLSKVLMRGGTIVEHGYTHQIGTAKTGISAEFFDETTQTWLSLENQKLRIATGANQIHSSLGFEPKGFEAPHYVANPDTFDALSQLGFQYVTQNSNTAFFDRFNLPSGMVNIPETLGYVPIDSAEDVKLRIESNMDYLYNMSGLMLYFNHLFDDQMLQTGKELLDYVLAKKDVWVTNGDALADFWAQRLNAFQSMDGWLSEADKSLTVKLGPSSRAGLTLAIGNLPEIKGVFINGNPWSVFDNDQVILPILPEKSNTITVTFRDSSNTNQVIGYPIVILFMVISVLIVLKNSRLRETSDLTRKKRQT